MKFTKQFQSFFLAIAVAVALVACGGGSSSGVTTSTAANVAITNANAQAVARDAYQALEASDDFPLKANDNAGSSSIAIVTLPRFLRDIVISNAGIRNAQFVARVEQCDVGFITIPDTSTGFGTYIFSNCSLAGITINGSVTISGSGDLNGSAFSGSFVFSQFSISGSGVPQTINLNGTLAFSWSIVAAIETGTVSGNYSVTVGSNSITVSGLSISYTSNLSTGENTETVSYTITSSAIGGTVTVATIQPFLSLDSEPYPRAGQLLITGANGSKLRFTVLGSGQPSGQVRIEVDSDGDDVYEDSSEISWATLDS
ncbi:MAG: hypothetical protein ACI9JR_002632 [Gammaproteobacteria bacterium]|jgi:hypothetical protein